MRAIFIVWYISHSLFSFAQNVGIGTLTPGEKLDVNGNVNVQGNVKVNGNAGTSGQVLMMNESGQQLWANAFGYKNRKEFIINGTWTVPAGVREIMIEAVGGGGGGAKGGGGGGGAYAIGIYKVTPSQIISFDIGLGGLGAVSENGTGVSGGITNVISGTSIIINAYGGTLAYSNSPGIGVSSYIYGDSLIYAKSFVGSNGKITTESYAQYNSTTFVTIRKYGDGGACMYNPVEIQDGTFLSFNTQTLSNISIIYSRQNFIVFNIGTGGGGGNSGGSNWGWDGGKGLVAISY